MANITTYGHISPRTAAHAVRQLLERGQHLLLTERFGQFDPQPKNETQTRKYRRYESLARATAPLVEGVTPAGQRLSYTDITCTLEQYGDIVILTDVVQDTHEDPVLQQTTKLLGEQMAETIEVVRLAVLKGGTNVFYAAAVTARASVNNAVARGDFRRIVRAFRRHKGRTIGTLIKASADIATYPVAPAFFAMAHTDLESDFRNCEGFVPVEQYSSTGPVLEGEIGKIESVRIVCSALVEPWMAAGVAGTTYLSGGSAVTTDTACDVYPILVVAQDSYGIVPLQGKNAVTPTIINPTPSAADPLGQRGYAGWKTWQTAVILNQLWLARLEVACTANPE